MGSKSLNQKLPQQDNEIQRMVEYIEQDGLEKVEEIDIKAEEEFNIEKNKIRDKEILHISLYYDRLEEQIHRQSKAEFCRTSHQSRLKYLSAQYDILTDIKEQAKERLKNVDCGDNADAYKKILTSLILQGLLKMLDKKVNIRFRDKDKNIIDDCISKAKSAYEDATKVDDIEIIKDETNLPDTCTGGITLLMNNGLISIENTLEARLYVIAEKPDSLNLPQYRLMLYGPNPNRKHFD